MGGAGRTAIQMNRVTAARKKVAWKNVESRPRVVGGVVMPHYGVGGPRGVRPVPVRTNPGRTVNPDFILGGTRRGGAPGTPLHNFLNEDYYGRPRQGGKKGFRVFFSFSSRVNMPPIKTAADSAGPAGQRFLRRLLPRVRAGFRWTPKMRPRARGDGPPGRGATAGGPGLP